MDTTLHTRLAHRPAPLRLATINGRTVALTRTGVAIGLLAEPPAAVRRMAARTAHAGPRLPDHPQHITRQDLRHAATDWAEQQHRADLAWRRIYRLAQQPPVRAQPPTPRGPGRITRRAGAGRVALFGFVCGLAAVCALAWLWRQA